MSPVQQQPNATVDARFGRAVSSARQARRLSQRDLAALLTGAGMPVDASAVSRIEAGTRSVRLREAETIAQALGMNLAALLIGDESMETHFRSSIDRAVISLGTARPPLVDLLMWTQALMEEARMNPALLRECGGTHRPEKWTDVPRWLIENYLPMRAEDDPSIGIDDFAQFNDDKERKVLVEFAATLGDRLSEQGTPAEWLGEQIDASGKWSEAPS